MPSNFPLKRTTAKPKPTSMPHSPPPTSRPNSMVLAKPQPFNGTRGAAAKSFVGQILLHTVTYPDRFPTNSRKVAFSISFMTDYAATWSQPYLMKVFNAEEVALEELLDDFKSSFFYPNCQHHAEVALQSLPQTGTVSAYTQEFNSHAVGTEEASLW
ncbi:uncharacterized protein VP01_1538g1 [Puccinia sorghi]|uniref:Retrotransposon gag domain-containing protein n=1 Tax=Puccinia sorghi TaxID=27349 RepID=A0A0L6VJ10_9BASI|nr:uncharacterized protein VP01_1538g1 [Puccinia sorghi]